MRKYQEGRGSRTTDWKVNEAYTTWEHQARVYGMQITNMTMTDKNTERWEILAKPIREMDGGEIWMRFDKDHEVGAVFGM